MGDSIERLLALGWPGSDDYFRREARKQAEELAAKLREEARGKEADELLARLPAAEARDLFIRLTWDGDADFDLASPGTAGRRGPVLDAPNGLRRLDPQEWLRQSPGGNLRLPPRLRRRLHGPHHDGLHQSRQAANPAHPRDDHPRGDGRRRKKQTHTLVPDDQGAKPVVVPLTGGRRKTVLPFLSPEAIVESWFVTPPGPQASKASQGSAATRGRRRAQGARAAMSDRHAPKR